MRNSSRKKRDPVKWLLEQEAAAYDDSQQSTRPRKGVTWFAVDSADCIAMLDSREAGYVPRAVFANSKDEHVKLYEFFIRPSEEQMSGDVEVDGPEQGLYFYDLADFYKRPVLVAATLNLDGYDRLAIPRSPLRISDCPEEIRKLAEAVRFEGLFAETLRLRAAEHWNCI